MAEADNIKGVSVLGATGTVGVNTLDVVRRHNDRFTIVALTGHRAVDRLYEQCLAHRPRYAVMADPAAADGLRRKLRDAAPEIEVRGGAAAVEAAAALPEADYVMAAIVGAAGLLPSLAAARAGKRLLLANKEALVMAGPLLMAAVREGGAELLPIDSEHNAVFQCLPRGRPDRGLDAAGIRRIVLTASGGPFAETPVDALDGVSPEQACAHPRWVMGRKISVDSATMMNKGLEVIEACWLFETSCDRVDVILHPQSLVHSMVEYADGSMLAQLSQADMRIPIAHALAWPERMDSGAEALDLTAAGPLEFAAPDPERFPCLALAYRAARAGGTGPAVLNAANEVAVGAFLDGRLGFTGIARVVEAVMDEIAPDAASTLEMVHAADAAARAAASRRLATARPPRERA